MSSRKSGHGEQISDLPSYYSSNGTRDRSSLIRSKARSGPNRSTKASGKLKILPEEPEDAGGSTATPQLPSSTRKSTTKNSGSDGQIPLNGASTTLSAFHSPSSKHINGVLDERRNKDEHDEDDDDDDDDDDDSSDDGDGDEADEQRAKLAKQLDLAKIPEGSMRRDARRITRKGRASLPRVTAYSTATSYRMRELTKWLQARRETHRTNAMTFDECVYSTYTYELVEQSRGMNSHSHPPQHSGLNSRDTLRNDVRNIAPLSTSNERVGDLLGIPELQEQLNERSTAGLNNETAGGSIAAEGEVDQREEVRLRRREEARRRRRERFVVHGMVPEVFFMEYGTVVIWGMTVAEERRLLRELRRFEVEKLAAEDVESEDLNWYLADYSRIYNDVITLRKGSSYMTKLSLSHALAQSTKISFFEGVIDNTIDTTKDIPQSIAESGKIGLPPIDIMKQIGHLFILRMNIHLVGSIVDSPEIFWAQPDLEPLYSAARSYLEIPQRIELLNARVDVLQDMLQLLKDQVTSSHSEWLEIIVIVLILLEIILGVATMVVDLYFA